MKRIAYEPWVMFKVIHHQFYTLDKPDTVKKKTKKLKLIVKGKIFCRLCRVLNVT